MCLEKTTTFEEINQLKLFIRLFRYVIPHWDKYLLIIILQMIQGTIHALPFLLLSKLPLFVGTERAGDYINFCLLMLFPALIFRYVIFENILTTLNWYIGLKLSLRFRQQLYRHVEKLSLNFYQSRPIGEHIYRANADIDAFIPLFNHPLNGFPTLITGIYQVLLMGYLVSIAGSEILFYLTMILIPIYSLVYMLYSIVQRLDYQKRARAQELTAVLRENIAGIRVIKAFGRLRYSIRRYFGALARYHRSAMAAYFMQTLVADQIRVSPVNILWPLSLPFFAYLGLKGEMPIVSWFGVIYFARQMLYFLDASYSFIQKMRVYLVPAQRLFETLDLKPEIDKPKSPIRIPLFKGQIAFDSVSFSYQKGYPVLKDISFNLNPGKKLAIVGASGAGKSTIALLALRLYKADTGTIRVDSRHINQLNMRSILSQTGIILQDTFLFGGTVRENIGYGYPDASDDQIIQAAIDAGIHEDIMDLPGGYNMNVAEGANLSSGQKQRIGIARALIKQPKMLLLDEATASLDSTTEEAIMKTLKQALKHVTTIIISHRVRMVMEADEILVLDKGYIAERGSHEMLMKKKNLYYRFYLQQI